FAALLASGWKGQDGVRCLFAGDAADSLVSELRTRKANVWSVFGTPRTGLVAFAREHTDARATGELGKPLAHVQVRVLEASGALAPILVNGAFEVSAYGLPAVTESERARWRTDGTLER